MIVISVFCQLCNEESLKLPEKVECIEPGLYIGAEHLTWVVKHSKLERGQLNSPFARDNPANTRQSVK